MTEADAHKKIYLHIEHIIRYLNFNVYLLFIIRLNLSYLQKTFYLN